MSFEMLSLSLSPCSLPILARSLIISGHHLIKHTHTRRRRSNQGPDWSSHRERCQYNNTGQSGLLTRSLEVTRSPPRPPHRAPLHRRRAESDHRALITVLIMGITLLHIRPFIASFNSQRLTPLYAESAACVRNCRCGKRLAHRKLER
jgi:hypothetical protein